MKLIKYKRLISSILLQKLHFTKCKLYYYIYYYKNLNQSIWNDNVTILIKGRT